MMQDPFLIAVVVVLLAFLYAAREARIPAVGVLAVLCASALVAWCIIHGLRVW